MQEWHGTRDTIIRDMARIVWYKGPRKDRHTRGVVRRNQKATMALGIEA
jgi:hypothetical protein